MLHHSNGQPVPATVAEVEAAPAESASWLDRPTTSADSGVPGTVEASRVLFAGARAAWKVLGTGGVDWDTWLAVGRGLEECQKLALERAQSNDMSSQRAKKEMAKLLDAEQLACINKSVRSVLLAVMRDMPAIAAWRDTLTSTERMRMNHPQAVMRRYKRATIIPPPKPDDGAAAAPARGLKAAYQIADAEVQAAKNEIIELKQRLKTEVRLDGHFEAAMQSAKTEISELRQRLKTEGSGFDWNSDTPDNIARAVVDSIDRQRAERIAQAMLHFLRDPPKGKREGQGQIETSCAPWPSPAR
jgi:hypothetical protein